MKLLAEITRDCLELPVSQRLKLARILIDISDQDSEFSAEAESAWNAEINARVLAVRNGTADSRPIIEVFDQIDRAFPG
jgi:hypothetical protein